MYWVVGVQQAVVVIIYSYKTPHKDRRECGMLRARDNAGVM